MPTASMTGVGEWTETGVRGVQVAEDGEVTGSAPIVSRPVLDAVRLLGEQSRVFVSLDSLARTAAVQLPPKAAAQAIALCGAPGAKADRFRNAAHFVKNWWAGTKVLETLPPEQVFVPVGELHRPKVHGCTATFAFERKRETGHDLKVSVAGNGFGASVTRAVSFARRFRALEDCVRLVMPVTVQVEKVRTAAGEIHWRSNVLALDLDVQPQLIPSDEDPCGRHAAAKPGQPWLTQAHDFPVPKGVEQDEELGVEEAQGCQFEVGFKAGGVEIVLTSSVKTLRSMAYTYSLVGPHTYTGYLPQGKIAYYWNWASGA